jgi:hypothetical protein
MSCRHCDEYERRVQLDKHTIVLVGDTWQKHTERCSRSLRVVKADRRGDKYMVAWIPDRNDPPDILQLSPREFHPFEVNRRWFTDIWLILKDRKWRSVEEHYLQQFFGVAEIEVLGG